MILIGDVQVDVARIMRTKLNEAINEGEELSKKIDSDELYINVVFQYERQNKAFRLRLITTDFEPPKLLGTSCYKVNYRSGSVERLWILPMQQDDLLAMAAATHGLSDEAVSKEIIRSAQSIKPALLYRPSGSITGRA